MISHGKNVKVFSANANRPFAEGVCRKLWLPMGDCYASFFYVITRIVPCFALS